MKQLNLDLGYTNKDRYGDMKVSTAVDEETIHYPTFVYEDEDELGIPEKGKMMISYEEVASEKSKRNGKTRYICTIAVKCIESVEGAKDERPAKSDTSASDALDKIAEALSEANESDEDE